MGKELSIKNNWYQELVSDLKKLAFDGIVKTKMKQRIFVL